MFALTRQMIIDDDLGAFTDIPRAIGIGAAEAINDAVWGCVLANGPQRDTFPFFGVEHLNLMTGPEAKLCIDGLTAAEIKFAEQERVPGRPLGIPASIMLVPVSLKVTAEMLMKSLTVNESTDPNKPKPVNNPHAGKYEIISSLPAPKQD
jgi:phage major head subunit gpT-like protein